jgi:hypothetical protein
VTVLVLHRDDAVQDCEPVERVETMLDADDGTKERQQMNGGRMASDLHPVVEAADKWFKSPIGIARSVRLVNQMRYPFTAKSLCSEALHQIWLATYRNPKMQVDNIEAYCQTVMRNACSGRRAKREFVQLDRILGVLGNDGWFEEASVQLFDDSDLHERIKESAESPTGTSEARDAYQVGSLEAASGDAPASKDDLSIFLPVFSRSMIETQSIPDNVKASALNFLTLSAYPDIDCSDLPQPERGADQRRALWWAAIALALQDSSYFPSKSGSSSSQRQKLSRFVGRCEQLIARVAVAHLGKENVDE